MRPGRTRPGTDSPDHTVRKDTIALPVCWQRGAARLLRYPRLAGGRSYPPVLLVPPLINRYFILDLKPPRSLARYLAGQGVDVFLLDWGEPGGEEKGFTLDDYIFNYLAGAVAAVRGAAGPQAERPVLAGYCMGGLLSLALAQHEGERLGGLVLLATPWDFRPVLPFDRDLLPGDDALPAFLKQWLQRREEVPGRQVQAFFQWLDPAGVYHKWERAAAVASGSASMDNFLEVEEWVCRPVALTAGVAETCLIDWLLENCPMKGNWKVGGQAVNPELIDLPCFMAMPRHDRLVPLASALPLCDRMRQVRAVTPQTGHIGLVAGRSARSECWEPLMQWLGELAG